MMRDNEQTVDTEIVISIFGVMLLHITLNFKFLNILVFGGLSATLILTRARNIRLNCKYFNAAMFPGQKHRLRMRSPQSVGETEAPGPRPQA
jgi:hypothetical protein